VGWVSVSESPSPLPVNHCLLKGTWRGIGEGGQCGSRYVYTSRMDLDRLVVQSCPWHCAAVSYRGIAGGSPMTWARPDPCEPILSRSS
jgi:hypothetical protein